VEQLGELQSQVASLEQYADVYVINSDTPENSRKLKEMKGITIPVLLDRDLAVARQFDMLPKPGQPMGGMGGVAQMGFVVIDGNGTIRVQRVDTHFGQDADQIFEILMFIGVPPPATTVTN
jgi:peroxiredoxin